MEQHLILAPGWQGFAGISYSSVGVRLGDISIVQDAGPLHLPGYNILDLHAGVQQGRWQVELYAKNLANSRGILAASAESLIDPVHGPYNASYQMPRTFGVAASVGF